MIGLVWFGLVWFGLFWFGLVWFFCYSESVAAGRGVHLDLTEQLRFEPQEERREGHEEETGQVLNKDFFTILFQRVKLKNYN